MLGVSAAHGPRGVGEAFAAAGDGNQHIIKAISAICSKNNSAGSIDSAAINPNIGITGYISTAINFAIFLAVKPMMAPITAPAPNSRPNC